MCNLYMECLTARNCNGCLIPTIKMLPIFILNIAPAACIILSTHFSFLATVSNNLLHKITPYIKSHLMYVKQNWEKTIWS